MVLLREYRDEVREFFDEFPDASRLKKVGLGLFAVAGVYLERSYLREVATYPVVDSVVSGLSELAVHEDKEILTKELEEILHES